MERPGIPSLLSQKVKLRLFGEGIGVSWLVGVLFHADRFLVRLL